MKIVLDSSAIAAFFKDPFSNAVERTLKHYAKYYTVDFA